MTDKASTDKTVEGSTTALPPELIEWAQQSFGVTSYDRLTTLIRQDQATDALFLLVAGRGVVLAREASSGKQVELTTLEAPQMVGEMSWLEKKHPTATVQASKESQWIRIPFQDLDISMRDSPVLADLIYQSMARKLAEQMNQQNTFIHRWERIEVEPLRKVLLLFCHLNDDDVDWLSAQGSLHHHAEGTVVIQQGELLSTIAFVLRGTANVQLGDHIVGSSRCGEILGEMSLLNGDDRAGASVQTNSSLALLCIDKQRLRQRIDKDHAFSARFHHGLAVLLSHRCRDSLQAYGLQSADRTDGELDLRLLEQLGQASRRFDRLCRQWLN